MTPHGIKLLVLVLCLSLSLITGVYCQDKEFQVKNPETSAQKKTVFSELANVTVISVICGAKIDNGKIKEVIYRALSSFGNLRFSSSENFGKGRAVLQIMLGPAAEQSLLPNTPAKYLPVIFLSMQLSTGAELIANKNFLVSGLIWEKQGYVDANQKNLNVSLEKAIELMLNELKKNYEETDVKPDFFVINI